MSEAFCRLQVPLRAISIYDQGVPVGTDTVVPMCEHCGRRRLAELHHRLNRSQGGEWSCSNIIGLCQVCHQGVTVNPALGAHSGLHLTWSEPPEQTPVAVWYSRDPVLFDDDGGWSPVVDKD